ncbi:MAG: glucose-1-phosphate cytidylyltransferase [Acidimicrobiia bacterium]
MLKVVILAGGKGTRLSQETATVPKPMLEVGGYPLVWHIMDHFSSYGFEEFVLALGYKAEAFKDYFLRYPYLHSNITLSLSTATVEIYEPEARPWRVHLVDTGLDTATGGRLRRLRGLLEKERFFVTYGDGISDVDLKEVLEHHDSHTKSVTITAVNPPSQFGEVIFDDDGVTARFVEKPSLDDRWINGGYMVVEPDVLEEIQSDETSLEYDVLQLLGRQGRLGAYRHRGFWMCVDTGKDLERLRKMWVSGAAPWTRKHG